MPSFAYLVVGVSRRGTYTLIIDDIVLDDYRFDGDNSVLNASIKVK
jgi:hypothetical protein